MYGGSVAKHTYVDGLSDVDALFVLTGDAWKDKGPQEVLKDFAAMLADRLTRGSKVSIGELAVTVEYGDGMILQCLPAVRQDGQLRISSGSPVKRKTSLLALIHGL